MRSGPCRLISVSPTPSWLMCPWQAIEKLSPIWPPRDGTQFGLDDATGSELPQQLEKTRRPHSCSPARGSREVPRPVYRSGPAPPLGSPWCERGRVLGRTLPRCHVGSPFGATTVPHAGSWRCCPCHGSQRRHRALKGSRTLRDPTPAARRRRSRRGAGRSGDRLPYLGIDGRFAHGCRHESQRIHSGHRDRWAVLD